jgi:hypothetical protein
MARKNKRNKLSSRAQTQNDVNGAASISQLTTTAPSAKLPATANKSAMLLALLLAAGALAAIPMVRRYLAKSPQPAIVATPAIDLQQTLYPTNTCKQTPQFVSALNLPGVVSLSTSERDALGLAVIATDPNNQRRTALWQHPTWKQAGNLSALATDQRGDIYVIPSPRINLIDNPPELQNTLYKIDRSSGEMRVALKFPVAKPISQRNPFAGMGLHYDCISDSLYLSSIAGSDASQERGSLFRIALQPRPAIAARYDGFDAIAIASATTSGSKHADRLLLGRARNAEVWQMQLDAKGDFVGEPTRWLDLFGLGPDGNERARKFELTTKGELKISGTKFQYNLVQPPTQLPLAKYIFLPNAGSDAVEKGYVFERWVF